MKLFYNGHIYNQSNTCFVEENGKIIKIGNDELLNQYDCKHIDLKGKYIYPGFNDSHMHLINYGQVLSRVVLKDHTYSLEAMLNKLKEYKGQGWIIGRGWNHDYFQDVSRFPTKQDLDSVSTTQPIYIVRACGHVAVANSKAIELCNIHPIDGGTYNLETGLFEENAVYLLTDSTPKPTHEDIENYILKAQASLNSYGITSVQSDDFISATHDYHDALEVLEKMSKENKLTVRIYEQTQFHSFEDFQSFIQEGYSTGKGNEYFKIGPLKIIGDGSLGARTAALSMPYHDKQDTQGMKIYSANKLHEIMEYAHIHNMQIAIHAIGDATVDDVLDGYEYIIKKHPKPHRHGIVHCQITRQDQLDRFKELSIHGYIQSIFLDYDSHIVESRVGHLKDTSYNFKTLYDITTVSNGSDCPVELPDVLKGMQIACTRQSIDGTTFLENQALTVKQAIDSYTKDGAYISYEEDIKGQIQEGMYCDFVVLNQDLENIDLHQIKDVEILSTYIGGKEVYKKG